MHGPYWSSIRWVDGRPVTQYIGRQMPAEILALRPAASVPEPTPDLTPRQAARRLGVSMGHPYDRVVAARDVLLAVHRDWSDDSRIVRGEIWSAWKALAQYHGWV